MSFDSNVHIFEHIHRNDYSGEEQRSCFLAPNDYTEMRAERKITLKLMEGGQPTVNDGKKYYRGLEAKTREGFRRKQFHMVDAAMTVLDEQSLQAQNEICDTRVISKLYISCTAHCVRAAQERGLIDQQAALEPVSVAAQPPCPRRQPRRLSYTAA